MATNPYINRVDIQRGNSTETLINIGDTTAVASDVAQGKYFYLASGEKVEGTSSGGGMDIPTFTVTFDSTFSTVQTITCDKTLAECRSIVRDDGMCMAVVEVTSAGSQDEPMAYTANCVIANYEGNVCYCVYDQQTNPIPIFDLDYQSDSSIEMIEPSGWIIQGEYTENGTYSAGGYIINPIVVDVPTSTPTLQSKTATPTEQQQTVTPDSGYDGLSSVTVGAVSSTYVGSQVPRFTLGNDWVVTPTEEQSMVMADGEYLEGGDIYVGAISSTYVGSGITQRSSSDLTASGATVTVPAGYYASQASKAVASGTAGTPTATKGTVSNHAISVTPSVTNTAGYISGGTKTGTAVSVVASELVSGTLTISSSGTKDVTNYASASVGAGSVNAPTATKGTVSNNTVSVTPSVSFGAGYIEGGSSIGTAVSVSASELVSGSETKTANGTYNVTNLASLVVAVPIVTYYTSSSNPTSSQGSNGDIWLVTS